MILRPYQEQALTAIGAELARVRSTLLVMATGLGKTAIGSAVVRDWPGRCLWIAHRDELLQQAQGRLESDTERVVELEQASWAASRLHRNTVVGSIQTLAQAKRLEGWRPDAFDLVVVDEAHHATAPTYRRVLAHFADAKVLGLTATPDRGDRAALGQVFDSVAGVWDIEDGINDGWLCPIRVTAVDARTINLESVRTTAGDLNGGDLDAVMATEENLHAVARPTLELAGDRRTIVFTTSVENAHRLAEVFCRYRHDCARAVDGKTDRDERRQILADHQAGRFQILVNVAVLTEGYDDPKVSCIAMGRPTKSRALYTQMAGRGTRIAEGKSDLLILDFTPNSQRHKLVTAHDILAGKYSDEVVTRARKLAEKKPGMDVQQALNLADAMLKREQASREEVARRERVKAKVEYATSSVDPFGVLGVPDPTKSWGDQFGAAPASEKQLAALQRMKVPIPSGCTKQQATRLLGTVISRREQGLCTFGQMRALQKRGYDARSITFGQASRLLDAIAKNGWQNLPSDESRRLLGQAA